MKSYRLFTILFIMFAFVLTGYGQSKSEKPQQYKKLQYPVIRKVQIPDPARFELPNGMIVYLLEDHTLPTINATVMVKSGSRYEPMDKTGLASLTGQVMRTGGTTTKKGDEIDEMLEKVGASVETYIGTSSGGARLSVLKENIDLGLSVLNDLLRNPVFSDDKLELAKVTARSGISRRNDDIGGIAAREFTRLVYGPAVPYGRIQEYTHIENITRNDLVEFHKKYFAPNTTMMAVWGDFDTQEMKKKLENIFGSWEKREVKLPPLPQPRMAKEKTVSFIKKDDVNQSQIALGHLGGVLNETESSQLNLADVAFGGAFASRLFKKVRSDQGLAYSVYSSWGEDWDYPGVFRLGGSTKSGSTVTMIRSILSEFSDVIKNGITDEELKFAKESYLNSFVFNYDTKGKIVSQLLMFEFFGYPKDFIQKQQNEVQSATKQSVNTAIKKRWDENALAILVVGKDADFDEPLSALGAVNTIDITIPAPPEKIPEPTPETIGKGKEIIQKALTAMGGEKVLQVKDVTAAGKMKAVTPMGEMEMNIETTNLLPDKQYQKMVLPMGEMVMAMAGKSGWMKMGSVREMPSSQAEEMYKNQMLDPLTVMQNLTSKDYVIYYYKDEKVQETPAAGIIVKFIPANATARWFLDAQTGMLLKSVVRQTGQSGPVDAEVFYSDYRDVDGVKFAFKTMQQSEGKKQMETALTSVKINSGVKDDLFKKPQ